MKSDWYKWVAGGALAVAFALVTFIGGQWSASSDIDVVAKDLVAVRGEVTELRTRQEALVETADRERTEIARRLAGIDSKLDSIQDRVYSLKGVRKGD